MKILAISALLLAFSASAQAPEPVRLARGNVLGEPHHHLKIENEYIRAYYVEVPPHEATQLHQHDHDYLYVSLGPADVVSEVRDKPEVHLQLKDGETHFTRGGFAHVARNLADTPFRNVTIELLRPQEAARNVCMEVIPNQGTAICDPEIASVSTIPDFETEELRLDHFWLSSKRKHKEKASLLSFLVVALGGSEIKVYEKGKSPKALREGQVEWFDPGSDTQFSCERCKMARFLKLTFKDSRLGANH